MSQTNMNKPFSARNGLDTCGWKASIGLRLAAMGVVLASLAGCGSLSVGQSNFSCPGLPDGVQCMSTLDVYEATNDGNVPASMNRVADQQQWGVGSGSKSQSGYVPDPVRDHISAYVAPRLPDKPVPVRTPAEVMRIWVAPWEDTNGDLNVSGYMYTEIEPRRWVIGDPAPSSNPVLSPLTVRPTPKKAPGVQAAAPAAQPIAAVAAQQSTEATPSQEIK